MLPGSFPIPLLPIPRWQWVDPPNSVFPAGYQRWKQSVYDAIYAILVEEAPKVQAFMRANAPWHDSHDPSRSYLKAIPFRDDAAHLMGIIAYYDLAAYKQFNPKQDPRFNFGIAHETFTFVHVGVISIILPRRPGTVLGDEAPRIWDRIRALFM